MEFSHLNRFDIVEIYRQYSDIRSQNGFCHGNEDSRQGVETRMSKSSKEALAQLLKFVHSSLQMGNSLIYELSKLMSYLNLMVDFSEFSRFYEFVYFVCREDGQKNITVSRAVKAWKLVLDGRFRLLNQWCDFVENNQRHNVSEDTWQQVLAFSRCVHENLEGYDPEGAWPVLIDDFVEHMYRQSGSIKISNLSCNCGDSEPRSGAFEDSLPGLKIFPGLKRKLPEDKKKNEIDFLGGPITDSMEISPVTCVKKSRFIACKPVNWEINLPGNAADESTEVVQHNSPMGCSKSPCAVEGCLSKGFAGLFSTRSFLGLDQGRKASFTKR